SALQGRVHRHAAGTHPLQVLAMEAGLDDGQDLFARLDALVEIGIEDPVLLVHRRYERADVPARNAVPAEGDAPGDAQARGILALLPTHDAPPVVASGLDTLGKGRFRTANGSPGARDAVAAHR